MAAPFFSTPFQPYVYQVLAVNNVRGFRSILGFFVWFWSVNLLQVWVLIGVSNGAGGGFVF